MHPVAYYSRQTNDAEKKYHSYELETLAVVESVKKFRVYLLGVEFTLVTDCNSLSACTNQKQMAPRIARWMMLLQEYWFKKQYRPGNRMLHADALSRNPVDPQEVEEEDPFLPIRSLSVEEDWLVSAQRADPKLQGCAEFWKNHRSQEEIDMCIKIIV